MSGWIRCDHWPLIVEALPRPLSREAAAMDLRWLAYESGRPLPSQVELCERWGWVNDKGRLQRKRARLLMADEAAWKDPHLEKGQPRAKEGPSEGQARATNQRRKARFHRGKGQGRATEGPTEGQPRATRVETRAPDPNPTLTLQEDMSPESDDESESPSGQLFGDQPQKPARDLYDEAVEVWKAEVCEPLGRPKVQPCGRGTSAGKSLLARLTQPIDGLPSGIEAWTLICRWYATSQHKRAQWLRDGGYRAKTLVVPDNWVEYLAFAVEEEQQAPARASPAESRRRRTNDAMRRLAERFDT